MKTFDNKIAKFIAVFFLFFFSLNLFSMEKGDQPNNEKKFKKASGKRKKKLKIDQTDNILFLGVESGLPECDFMKRYPELFREMRGKEHTVYFTRYKVDKKHIIYYNCDTLIHNRKINYYRPVCDVNAINITKSFLFNSTSRKTSVKRFPHVVFIGPAIRGNIKGHKRREINTDLMLDFVKSARKITNSVWIVQKLPCSNSVVEFTKDGNSFKYKYRYHDLYPCIYHFDQLLFEKFGNNCSIEGYYPFDDKDVDPLKYDLERGTRYVTLEDRVNNKRKNFNIMRKFETVLHITFNN